MRCAQLRDLRNSAFAVLHKKARWWPQKVTQAWADTTTAWPVGWRILADAYQGREDESLKRATDRGSDVSSKLTPH
jgi:hypothetical protein